MSTPYAGLYNSERVVLGQITWPRMMPDGTIKKDAIWDVCAPDSLALASVTPLEQMESDAQSNTISRMEPAARAKAYAAMGAGTFGLTMQEDPGMAVQYGMAVSQEEQIALADFKIEVLCEMPQGWVSQMHQVPGHKARATYKAASDEVERLMTLYNASKREAAKEEETAGEPAELLLLDPQNKSKSKK